jgi:hypothetical protein
MNATISPFAVEETKLPARGAPALRAEVDIVLVGLLVDDDRVDVLAEPVAELLPSRELEPVVELLLIEELLGSVNEPDQLMPVSVDW